MKETTFVNFILIFWQYKFVVLGENLLPELGDFEATTSLISAPKRVDPAYISTIVKLSRSRNLTLTSIVSSYAFISLVVATRKAYFGRISSSFRSGVRENSTDISTDAYCQPTDIVELILRPFKPYIPGRLWNFGKSMSNDVVPVYYTCKTGGNNLLMALSTRNLLTFLYTGGVASACLSACIIKIAALRGYPVPARAVSTATALCRLVALGNATGYIRGNETR